MNETSRTTIEYDLADREAPEEDSAKGGRMGKIRAVAIGQSYENAAFAVYDCG